MAEGAALITELLPRCTFPPPGTALACAVSGGPDSLALLILATAAGCTVTAIHVDHGLRAGSAAEAEVVVGAAQQVGAAIVRETVVVAPGPNLEARARAARFAVLPVGVATGHTMDHQAETVLLAVLRGAALDGLAGMSSDRPGRPRRPLLALRRSETVALCAAEGLTPVSDPSNDDPRFRRNRVRAEVLPLLFEVAGRDLVPVLARQAGLLSGDADLLDSLSASIDPTDVRALPAAPASLARRAIRRWLRSPGAFPDVETHPPSADEVARVLAVAAGEIRACQLAGGRRVERHAGRLTVAGR